MNHFRKNAYIITYANLWFSVILQEYKVNSDIEKEVNMLNN